MKKNILLLALLASVLTACDKKDAESPSAKAAVAENTIPANGATTGMPDVGRIEQVSVAAKGVGMTPGAAVNEALKNAIMQVNGVSVDASSANLNVLAHAASSVDIYSDQGHDWAKANATLQGQAYADQIIAESKGVISSFRITKVVPPTAKSDGSYSVDIEAKVAKFSVPADAGKIKIVVAPIRTKARTFDIGGRTVPANEVLDILHRQIVDALTQTGRFTVLDRQYSDEIQNELNMIDSGQSVKTDMAKLGQALTADLVWVGELDSFAYTRSARQLQSSDRELVSYGGGWSMSQRLINLATRQIQQSSTLQGTAPAIAPTTMSRGIDANKTLAGMETEIAKSAAEAILLRTFPISIVERTGNQVVLSQGGAALKPKSRYRVYLLGKELKDPQTGQSLGKMESPCCEVVIDRVAPNVSYATLENVQVPIDNVPPGALQLREALPMAAPAKTEAAAAEGASSSPQKPKSSHGTRGTEAKSPSAADKPKEKSDW